MNFLDHFTSIDDLLVSLLERLGGVTEEDTHFFSYPNDGSRATITSGSTSIDFMGGTIMTPAGVVSSLGNSLRARGREYCRSLSMQADRDIIIQIGTKSKIPVFAGTWFKVAHLRFTDVKIVAAQDTNIFVIACTNPDSIEMAGETYVKDPVDVAGQIRTMGNTELAVRMHAPPLTFDRRGDVLKWVDFESGTPNYLVTTVNAPPHGRSTDTAANYDYSYKGELDNTHDRVKIEMLTNDFHIGRMGIQTQFSSNGTSADFDIGLLCYTGTRALNGTLSYDPEDDELKYAGPAGYVVIDNDVDYYKSIYNFSTLKLVVDFITKKPVRAIAFGKEYDLSSYDLEDSPSLIDRHIVTNATLNGNTGVLTAAYIDNIILTENEPL